MLTGLTVHPDVVPPTFISLCFPAGETGLLNCPSQAGADRTRAAGTSSSSRCSGCSVARSPRRSRSARSRAPGRRTTCPVALAWLKVPLGAFVAILGILGRPRWVRPGAVAARHPGPDPGVRPAVRLLPAAVHRRPGQQGTLAGRRPAHQGAQHGDPRHRGDPRDGVRPPAEVPGPRTPHDAPEGVTPLTCLSRRRRGSATRQQHLDLAAVGAGHPAALRAGEHGRRVEARRAGRHRASCRARAAPGRARPRRRRPAGPARSPAGRRRAPGRGAAPSVPG